jgi:hypothetical protein
MSLCDEVPNLNHEPVVFSRVKKADHDEIDRLTSEFIAMGGGVKEIPYGVCTTTEDNRPNRNEYTGELSIAEFKSRDNSRKKNQKKMKTEKPTNDYGDW